MNRYLPVPQAIELQNTDEGENDLDGDGDGDGENPLMMVMVMMHMLMLPPMLMLMTLSFHCDHEHELDRQSMPNRQSMSYFGNRYRRRWFPCCCIVGHGFIQGPTVRSFAPTNVSS